jgi:alkanesulfonate monooxygenase SsuD/methylene tetrahydromethanopterin reductase-like flavin-dependent oxidoreductase (luciferase family)
VRFGIFDWLDESGRDLGQTYEERLRMLELADRVGFHAYHLAEHHQTELSTVPSPNLFLSAIAQRTTRLRFGPLSYILPLYSPVRLLEEICMLDQLSGGRLEFGLSRGSTGEHIESDPEKARVMFHEGLQVILDGLSTGQIDHHGEHYTFDGLFTRLTPVQKPYPPLWYPTSSVSSIAWVAAQGINTAFSVHLASDFDKIAAMVKQYRSEFAAHVTDPGRLNGHVAAEDVNVGFSVHVHVAETDEQAIEQARPAFERFTHNYTYRFVRRGNPERYADRHTFDEELARGRIVVGSPSTVRQRLADFVDRSGANYVIGCFAFGSLTLDQILRSVQLFAEEVIPALSQERVLS